MRQHVRSVLRNWNQCGRSSAVDGDGLLSSEAGPAPSGAGKRPCSVPAAAGLSGTKHRRRRRHTYVHQQRRNHGPVGESGCGKSTLGEVLIGLQKPTGGFIKFLSTELNSISDAQHKEFRYNIQTIFQDPYKSLNPRFSVEQWIRKPLEVHDIDNQDECIYKTLERAGLTPPESYGGEYPHELSGGERQRVSIA